MTDKVRLIDNERLDIPDTLALQELVYEYISRTLGGVFGRASGCVDPPTFTVNHAAKTITVGSGTFYHFKIVNGLTEGYIIRHDASLPQSPDGVTYGQFNPDDNTLGNFYIWARRSADSADGNNVEENRRVWNPATGVEDHKAIKTRHIEVCEFVAKATNPGGEGTEEGAEWFRIGVVAAASAADQLGAADEGFSVLYPTGDYILNENGVTYEARPRPLYVWDFETSPNQATGYTGAPKDQFRMPDSADYGQVNFVDPVGDGVGIFRGYRNVYARYSSFRELHFGVQVSHWLSGHALPNA